LAVAAYFAGLQVWTYLQMPVMAIGASLSSMVGQNIGAGRWDRVDQIARAGIIVGLVTLHVGAIAFYWFRRRQNLVAPMWHGDKRLAADVPGAVDDGRSRTIAVVVVLVCALGVAGVVRLGG